MTLHLLSHSVYSYDDPIGADAKGVLGGIGADGVELLTSFDRPDPSLRDIAVSVHLPHAIDWMAAWEGEPLDLHGDSALFYMYGRSREEVVSNLGGAIRNAATLGPAYGVLHAADCAVADLNRRSYSRDSRHVLETFVEMVNTVASTFPGGEPPFRILFENLWWPGLRLVDDSDYRYLAGRVEFSNWGICLDTGHLMNCLPGIRSQSDGVEALAGIFDGYCSDLIDSIETVHLHWSASWDYRSSFEERECDGPLEDFIASAFPHISNIDNHRPYTDPRVADLVSLLDPQYLTYEFAGPSRFDDFRLQRALFP